MNTCAQFSDSAARPLTFDSCGEDDHVGALARAERAALYAEAVARGADYYRAFAFGFRRTVALALAPHEALGCALLAGPEVGTTFRSIQVGSMVLSDQNNDPRAMAEFAVKFGVTFRLMALAEVAMEADDCPHFWQAVRQSLKAEGCYCTDSFIPGVSRLTSKLGKQWLRTNYSHPFVRLRITA